MLCVILGLAGLLVPSGARKTEKLEVRFGFAESVQASDAATERFRLEMVLSAKAQSDYSNKMEKFYERLRSLYGAPQPGVDEKELTGSEFRSLASERVGDLYTLVTPDGALEGTVMGGVIAIDPVYNDVEEPLFRLYLELSVVGSLAPRHGRTAVIGIRGTHRVGPWSAYQKTGPERPTHERVERFLRTQGVPLEKYRLSYFGSGSETLVVANSLQALPPDDQPSPAPSMEARPGDGPPPRWEGGVYVLDGEGLTPLLPAQAGDPNTMDRVADFVPIAEFQVDGRRIYSVEKHGQWCCAGAPYVETHLFRANPGGRGVSEVGSSEGYPLCLGLSL
jgi:hypothetical protein